MSSISNWRIFLHCQRGGADGELRHWRDQLGVLPAWVKVMRWNHAGEVKGVDPRIGTVLRLIEMSEDDSWLTRPNGGAEFVRAAQSLSGGDWQYVTALEFVNEKVPFDDISRMVLLNEVMLQFVSECRARGVKPIIPSNAVANPRPENIRALMPAIRAAIQAGGYFSPHCYGPRDLFDQSALYVWCVDEQLRQLRLAGLAVPPGQVLIGEFGHDYLDSYRDPQGNNTSGPWRWIGMPVSQLKSELITAHQYMANRGYAGAFAYNFFGYNYLRAGLPEQRMDMAHQIKMMGFRRDPLTPEDNVPDVDPYELADVLLPGWYGDQLLQFAGAPPPPPPPPTELEYGYVKPGGTFENAYLRGRADESLRIGLTPRGTRLHFLGKVGPYYKVEAYIPDWLISALPVDVPSDLRDE